MLWAFSKASVWINIMSTSDPGTRDSGTRNRTSAERAPDEGSTAAADDTGSAPMFALPDPAVIARLANEFFAALPGNATTPDTVGASVPARATTGAVPAAPSLAESSPGGVIALDPAIPNIPTAPAAPGSLAYFLDRASPLNASPSLPSLNALRIRF